MNKFFRTLIKHRIIVLIITLVALCLTGWQLTQTKLNSDIASYLPDDSNSRRAITMLSEKFGINGDAIICIEGSAEDYESIAGVVDKLSALPELDEILWLGSYGDLVTFDGEKVVSAQSLIPDDNVKELTGGLFTEFEGKEYYLINISMKAANASEEAGETLKLIENIVSEYDGEYFIGGNAVQSNDMLESALGELPKFMIVGFAVILLILLLTTKSIMAAVIFLVTIGISIVFNLGTNFFTSSISTITFSVAAILQLALSMDYSIFLTHAYEELRKTNDDTEALVLAIRKTLVVIAASALTTVAGFCALFAMKFELGFDLGLCLAKGVSFSFITVILIQPCLMMTFRKACDKTKHKALDPEFKHLSRLPAKLRIAAPIIAVVLLVPALYFSMKVNYYYLDSGYDTEAVGPKGAIQASGNQSAFIVKTGTPEKQFELAEKILDVDGVTELTGYYALVDTMTRGIKIPIYSSLEVQDESTLLFEVELTPEKALDVLEGREPDLGIEEMARKAVITAAGNAMPPIIEERITQESMRLMRPLSSDEQQLIIQGIFEELTATYQENISKQLSDLQNNFEGMSEQFDEYKDKFFATVDGEEYTFITVKITGESEGAEAKAALKDIERIIDEVLEDDYPLLTGNTSTVMDLERTTQTDFLVISAISVALILIILFITFKGFITPLLLVLVIQLAIFINLAISPIMGQSLNFITYVIISAIQLGATIDYAILMTKNYHLALETQGQMEAIGSAVRSSAFPILVSVSILCGACLSVYFISSDTIIREVTLLIARGAFISGIMVLFMLPALLTFTGKKYKKLSHSEPMD